jgi:hypothetical protein
MTRVTASWLAACVVSLAFASFARAAQIPGGTRWDFLGTASVTDGPAGCCQPAIQDGEQVFGSITVTYFPPPPSAPDLKLPVVSVDVLSLDGTQHLLSMSGSALSQEVTETNGEPPIPGSRVGSPDQLKFFHPYIDGHDIVAMEIGLQPGFEIVHDPDASFALVDQDGTAWTSAINPRTGDFLPDTPPSADSFETRALTLVGPVGPGSDAEVITVQIDQFLPEPGVSSLLGAELLGLAALHTQRRTIAQKRSRKRS